MVYGRNVRGPLELLKEEWESKENRVMNINCQWVNELKQRLEMIRDIVVEREGLAKETMKVQYDKRANERELTEGQMVMMKKPRRSVEHRTRALMALG